MAFKIQDEVVVSLYGCTINSCEYVEDFSTKVVNMVFIFNLCVPFSFIYGTLGL